MLGESTGVATAWDMLERALNDTLDQTVNQPCWQLAGLDNGVRRFRHLTSGGGNGVSGTTTRHRATVAIAAPPAFVLHALLDAEQRGQWDALTADIKCVRWARGVGLCLRGISTALMAADMQSSELTKAPVWATESVMFLR